MTTKVPLLQDSQLDFASKKKIWAARTTPHLDNIPFVNISTPLLKATP
jgi:hypothetical protein